MEFEERLLQAINKLMNLSRGTLWIVKDQIWAKAIENFVLQRKAHPGLAIGKRSFLSLQDTMPMLLGTSRSLNRGFAVADVLQRGTGQKTYFSIIRPTSLSSNLLPFVPAIEFCGSHPNISRNDCKPSLSKKELDEFNHYLRNKGLNL